MPFKRDTAGSCADAVTGRDGSAGMDRKEQTPFERKQMLIGSALRDTLAHLRLGARTSFLSVGCSFHGQLFERRRKNANNSKGSVERRTFTAEMTVHYAGEIPLPATTWEPVVNCDDWTKRSLLIFTAIVIMLYLFWGIFLFAFPQVFPYARLLGKIMWVCFFLLSTLTMLALFARQRFNLWLERSLDHQVDLPAQRHPPDFLLSCSILHRRWWWAMGLLNSPRIIVTAHCVWGVVILVTADALAGFTASAISSAVALALYAGALSGGSLMLAMWAVCICCLWFVGPSFREYVGTVSLDDVSPNGHEFQLRPVVDACVEIFMVLFAVCIEGMLLSRIAQTKRDSAQWAAMLLRDIRTPLHSLLNSSEDLHAQFKARDILPTHGSPISRRQRNAEAVSEGADAVVSNTETIHACAHAMYSILCNISRVAPMGLGAAEQSILKTGFPLAQDDLATRCLDRIDESHDIKLAPLIDQVKILLVASAKARNQTCRFFWKDEDIMHVRGQDSEECLRFSKTEPSGNILQILMNLIGNACKFTPCGGEVSVQMTLDNSSSSVFQHRRITRSMERGDRVLVIDVEDAGPGVPHGLREKIFGAYDRGCALPETEGLGLGLSLVRECVEQLAGTVFCTEPSQGMHGAHFVVRIPCTLLSAPGMPEVDSQATFHAAAMGRVLVVDDNATNVFILRTLLLKAGFLEANIRSFASGETALEAIRSSRLKFGIAFLDLVLPGMDGIELTRNLARLRNATVRRSRSEPPVILIGSTASATQEVFDAWRHAGVSLLLSKPFGSQALNDVLTLAYKIQQEGQSSGRHTQHDSNEPQQPPLEVSSPFAAAWSAHPLLRAWISCLGITLIALAVFAALFGWFALLVFYMLAAAALLFLERYAWRVSPSMVFAVLFAVVTIGAVANGCKAHNSFSILAVFTGWRGHPTWRYVAYVIVGVVIVHGLRILDANQQGVCESRFGASANLHHFVDSVVISMLVSMFLVQMSLFQRSQATQDRWIHTISHDLRAPLHGICFAISEMQVQSGMMTGSIMTARASAQALLVTMDTSLRLASLALPLTQLTRLQDELPGTEIADFICDQLVGLVEPAYLDISSMRRRSTVVSQGFVIERSAYLFVVWKFLSFIPLYRSDGARIKVSLRLAEQGAHQSLVLDAVQLDIDNERTNRRASSRASDHCTPDAFSARLMNGTSCDVDRANMKTKFIDGFSFSLALRKLLRGRVELLEGDVTKHNFSWCLSLTVPVRALPTEPVPIMRPVGPSVMLAVVDDDPLHLRIIDRIFRNCGLVNIELFRTSAEFLDRASRIGPDGSPIILFVDLHMPTVNGPQFWKQNLGEILNFTNVETVACTADSSSSLVTRCLDAGISFVLPKPFSQQQMSTVLESIATNNPRFA